MSDIGFFVDLLEQQPPYKNVPISLEDYHALAECQILRIEGFCSNCEKERTFVSKNIGAQTRPLREQLAKNTPHPSPIPISPRVVRPGTNPESFEVNFIGVMFSCAYCGEEHHFTIRIDGNTICKSGQYPSFSRMETLSLRKYKNLISKYYTELTSAVNLYSQHLGIGAFVYLRRILEHLINAKYAKLPEQEGAAKFVEKLKAVEAVETVIPEELNEIKEQIYSILSKGVHEYTEDECFELFDAVFYVVTSILDQELFKKEQAAKAENAKKAIAKKLKK